MLFILKMRKILSLGNWAHGSEFGVIRAYHAVKNGILRLIIKFIFQRRRLKKVYYKHKFLQT